MPAATNKLIPQDRNKRKPSYSIQSHWRPRPRSLILIPPHPRLSLTGRGRAESSRRGRGSKFEIPLLQPLRFLYSRVRFLPQCATPVPVNATVWVGVDAESVTVSVPLSAPTILGLKVTWIVHVPLAAIVFPLHVSPVTL